MHISHLIINVVLYILIIIGVLYSILAMIYLKFLTKKYLKPIVRDEIIGDKKVKDHQLMQEYYKDRSSINILVLSGGGVKGLVPLYILSYIEQITGKKTGELFDFLSGSSTGAISVGSLCVADNEGNYKFSAKDIADDYEINAKKIFSSPWYHQLLSLFGLLAPRFLPDNKLAVLERYYADKTIGELKGNLLIPVYDLEQNNLQIVKNWNTPKHIFTENFLAKDLINGASSPPMLFPPVAFKIKDKDFLFTDPALLLNNPILHVLSHVRALLPNKYINLILVGNGGLGEVKYKYRNLFSFGLYGVYQYIFSAPSLSSKLYVEFIESYLEETGQLDPNITFFNINATPDEDLYNSDTSEVNMNRIKRFADKVLKQNLLTINKVAACVNRDKALKIDNSH